MLNGEIRGEIRLEKCLAFCVVSATPAIAQRASLRKLRRSKQIGVHLFLTCVDCKPSSWKLPTTRWCAVDSLGLMAAGGGGPPCRSKLTRTRRAFLCASIGKAALTSSVTRLTTDSSTRHVASYACKLVPLVISLLCSQRFASQRKLLMRAVSHFAVDKDEPRLEDTGS